MLNSTQSAVHNMQAPGSPIPGDLPGHVPQHEADSASPIIPSTAPGLPHSPVLPNNPAVAPAVSKAIEDVLSSEIGINTLLGRLKQCVATSKELATFFKNLAKAEDTKAKDLKNLARATQSHRAESRSGSYGQQFEQVALLHERMANNSIQFSLNLTQMQEDLLNLATDKERERKHWKQTGLSAESRAQDAEQAMEKAKSRYNSLAEDYDHARTGDRSSRKLNIRAIGKSSDQVEENLHQRVKAADEDYQAKVENAQHMRQELITTLRPQAVRALQQLIEECDSAITMQLQKFAGYSEQTLLKNGLLLAPGPDIPGQKSLRDHVTQIDNDGDLRAYILSFSGKVPPRPREIQYEQHPVLKPTAHATPAMQSSYSQPPIQGSLPHHPPAAQTPTSPSYSSGPPMQGSMHSQAPPPLLPTQSFGRFDTGFGGQTPTNEHPQHSPTGPNPPYPMGGAHGGSPYNQVPPQQSSFPHNGPGPGVAAAAPAAAFAGASRGPLGQGAGRPSTREGAVRGPGNGSPSHRLFGLTLNELFDRDKTPVPVIVIQCIQAVDHFGLETEGIYRVSGNQNHVNQLRTQFDNDAYRVDFRNPENFHHDVHVPANLLKLFFRELPESLLTRARYDDFIQAARIEDDIIRRDNLHAIINDLPDPNYATLRALVLHLHRINNHSTQNRMTPANLAVIFGPTLMGAHSGDMALAALQPKVVQTILANALQIFDED